MRNKNFTRQRIAQATFWERTHALREPKENLGTIPVRESGYSGLPISDALHAKEATPGFGMMRSKESKEPGAYVTQAETCGGTFSDTHSLPFSDTQSVPVDSLASVRHASELDNAI